MPIYEYECKSCEHTVELLLRSTTETPVCPDCGETKLEKVFSVPASPAVRDGGSSLPLSSGESCGAPRCCGGGCNF